MSVPTVLITGVSGFVGSWTARAAIKLGYRVRGTVRSLADTEKCNYLQSVIAGDSSNLELVEADLGKSEGWKDVVDGCKYILYTATSNNPKQEIFDNEVMGGLRAVLQCSARTERQPKRIILNSCLNTCLFGDKKKQDTFGETDWTSLTRKGVAAPIVTLTRAEASAWNYVQDLPPNRKFEFASLNPGFIIGPMCAQSRHSSFRYFQNILRGKPLRVSNTILNPVSVHDVARANLIAMRAPGVDGHRFLMTSKSLPSHDLLQFVIKEYKALGYPIKAETVSKLKLHFMAMVNYQADMVYPFVDLYRKIDTTLAKNILGMEFDDRLFELVRDTINSSIQCDLLPDATNGTSIKETYVTPDIDVEGIPLASTDMEDSPQTSSTPEEPKAATSP